MLKRGDKLRIYAKDTQKLFAELTIRECEPTEGDCFKVWFRDVPGEGPAVDPTKFVAVDSSDNEYEISSGWNIARENWGVVLRPR